MLKRLLPLLLCLLLTAGLAACGDPGAHQSPAPNPPATPTATPSAQPSPEVTPTPTPTPTPSPAVTPEPTPTPEITPTPSPTPEVPVYQFGTPLAGSEAVEDTHFDTAAFLGDSRTEGLELWGGIYHGDYFWARGMTVFRTDSQDCLVNGADGTKRTLLDALRQKEYASVYIMIGVNELGYAASSYELGMAELVDQVLAIQPNAVVYLQTLPPVNEDVARKSGLASYINNANIDAFNAAILRIAAEKRVVLLNTAEVYRDENGILPAELASDGCHFTFTGYLPWADYLRTHVMDAELYHTSRTAEPQPEPTIEPTAEPTTEPADEPTQEVTEP